MPRRKRRRQHEAAAGGGHRWLSTPVLAAFAAGIVGGFVLAFVPIVGIYVVVFLTGLTISHLVARRLRAGRAGQPQQPEPPSGPPSSKQTAR